MTSFLLMRHGEPDYSGPYRWDSPGWGKDLAPLTDKGEEQVILQINKIREFDPEIVVSSPATRALHSSLVLRSELIVPFRVEFDLHEWVPDRSFQWKTFEEVQTFGQDFIRCKGEWPAGETRPWETLSSMRSRALDVFRKYSTYSRVLAVCHGELIKSVTGVLNIELAGLVPLELEQQ